MSVQSPRYEFGPVEQPAMVAGVSGVQVAVVAATLLVAVGVVRAAADAAGFAVAAAVVVVGVAAAWWPIAGRTPAQWTPIAVGWLWGRLAGRHRLCAATPLLGLVDGAGSPTPPPTLTGVRILASDVTASGQRVGIVHDRAAGTYTAVLAVRGASFELADLDEKVRRLDAWGALLAGLARAASPVYRLQWVERTVAADDGDFVEFLAREGVLGWEHPAHRSYAALVADAGAATQPHEAFLVVAVSAVAARRAIRAAGGGDRGAAVVLLREVAALRRDLRAAEISVDGALTPRAVARALRVAFDPGADVLRPDATVFADEGEAQAWPLATQTTWGAYRSEGAWHATYWIAQWPRLAVGPDFLAHLLLGTAALRTVSLTMQPVAADRAAREVEQAITEGLADDALRERAGFLATARQRSRRDALTRREEELAAGHADYRLSGYVTVTAADLDALAVACGEVEQAAERSRLGLRRLYGQQDVAFTYTLPLARGLR